MVATFAWMLSTPSEEQVWCPVLGLKGYIDLTAKLSYAAPSSASPLLCPVEIKTGKPSAFNEVEHKAQVSIYVLMMILRDRCRVQRWYSFQMSQKYRQQSRGGF